MTNAEKFLKDGVSVKEFIEAYLDFSFSRVWKKDENSFENITKKFFEQEVKPTLTEDERVILRNIDKHFYTKIFRNECLFLHGEHTSDLVFTQYDHLFKFIKERRRIQYTRAARR